jgi:beta-1,4-mannosyltransferase
MNSWLAPHGRGGDVRILIAALHDAYNPYCRELGESYANHGCEVVYGLDSFWASNLQVDLVHVHWPEQLLMHWMRPDRHGPMVCEQIVHWKTSAKIIATIHNDQPHSPHPAWEAYYRRVYALCDGYVHHGERSRAWFARAFPELGERPAVVIRHGAYTSFPDDISPEAARDRLGIGEDAFVILTFGRWRSVAELRAVARGVRKARVPLKCLLLNELLPGRRFGSVLNRLELWRTLAGVRHTSYPAVLPPEDVQVPFRAADLLVVQRLRGLNSGNVALAVGFGVPVVSPDIGVFGEDVRRLGNSTFDPSDPDGLARALETASAADLQAIARRNLEAARTELAWPGLTAAILEFATALGADPPQARRGTHSGG